MSDAETVATLPAELQAIRRVKPGRPIASEAELDAALAEMAWIDAQGRLEQELLRQQIDRLESAVQQRMRLRVGRQIVGFAERRSDLQSAVHSYANEHREQLLAGGGKTRKLTHGTISWKAAPQVLTFAGGKSADDVAAAIDECTGILGALLRLLGRLKLFGLPLVRFLRCKPALDRQQILAAAKAGELSADDLAAIHLQLQQPADTLTVKLHEYRAEAHSERASKPRAGGA